MGMQRRGRGSGKASIKDSMGPQQLSGEEEAALQMLCTWVEAMLVCLKYGRSRLLQEVASEKEQLRDTLRLGES